MSKGARPIEEHDGSRIKWCRSCVRMWHFQAVVSEGTMKPVGEALRGEQTQPEGLCSPLSSVVPFLPPPCLAAKFAMLPVLFLYWRKPAWYKLRGQDVQKWQIHTLDFFVCLFSWHTRANLDWLGAGGLVGWGELLRKAFQGSELSATYQRLVNEAWN